MPAPFAALEFTTAISFPLFITTPRFSNVRSLALIGKERDEEGREKLLVVMSWPRRTIQNEAVRRAPLPRLLSKRAPAGAVVCSGCWGVALAGGVGVSRSSTVTLTDLVNGIGYVLKMPLGRPVLPNVPPADHGPSSSSHTAHHLAVTRPII